MSCFRPWKKYNDSGTYSIPCGWCMSCRLDHRQQLEHRCEYELINHNYVGSFVTFTYDDYHLYYQRDLSQLKQIVGSENMADYLKFYNNFEPSLCFKDFDNFIRRCHDYATKHECRPYIQSDFTYLSVGEYGHDFGRPHYHVLFFGLDFATLKPVFLNLWKKGLIDSLPILNGGIRYVLKYLDKQQHGQQSDDMYFNNFLEPPFMTFSQSLGSGLYYSQLDYCRETGCYRMHGKDIPLPQYFKDKLLSVSDFERVKSEGVFKSLQNARSRFNPLFETTYSSELYHKALKERGLISFARLHGESVDDIYLDNYKRYV